MFRKALTLPTFVFVLSLHAFPCQRVPSVAVVEMVKESDVIVRAIAANVALDKTRAPSTAPGQLIVTASVIVSFDLL